MEEKITLNPEEVDKIIQEYAQQRQTASQITVELSGVNNIDTLLLLDTMGKKQPSVSELAPVVEVMLDGRTITFKNGSDSIRTVAYNRGSGNALHLMFSDDPYLYDILQQTCYVLLLKKLTPHLGGSN